MITTETGHKRIARSMNRILLTASLFASASLIAGAANARPMTPEDVAKLESVGTIAVSPDGRRIADNVVTRHTASAEVAGFGQGKRARQRLWGTQIARRGRNPERRVVEKRDFPVGMGEMGQRREDPFEGLLDPFAQRGVSRPAECPKHPGYARLVKRRTLEMPPVSEHLLRQFAVEETKTTAKPARATLSVETRTDEREGAGIFEQMVAAQVMLGTRRQALDLVEDRTPEPFAEISRQDAHA